MLFLLGLQLFATTGLDDALLLRFIGNTLSDGLRSLPAKSVESLRQMRVREVVAGVHPVGIHGAEVLNLKLEERAGELLGVTKLLSESVGLELELAANNVHKEVDDEIHGRESIREEDESDNDGVLLEETER